MPAPTSPIDQNKRDRRPPDTRQSTRPRSAGTRTVSNHDAQVAMLPGLPPAQDVLPEEELRGPSSYLTPEELEECKQLTGEHFGLRGDWAQPYAHQIQAVVAARKHRSGYVDLPCGSGKSAVVYMLANDTNVHGKPPKRVLIVGGGRAPSFQLLEEGRANTTLGDVLTSALGSDNSKKKRTSADREVMVTSYHQLDSAGKSGTHGQRRFLRDTWDLIVLDECHAALADGKWANVQVIRSPHTVVIGLTGTPFRTPTQKDLEKAVHGNTLLEQSSSFLAELGPCFFAVPSKTLEREKLIANVTHVFMTVPQGRDMLDNYQTLTKTEKRDAAALNLNKALAICSVVKRHSERGECGICFVQKLACADALRMLIDQLPFLKGTAIVTGASGRDNKTSEHDQLLRGVLGKLERKEIPLAVLTKASEEGVRRRALSMSQHCFTCARPPPAAQRPQPRLRRNE